MDPRVIVCKRKDYVIRFENVSDLTFVHIEVNKWSSTVRRYLSKDWNALFSLHGGPIYALNEPHNDLKHQKFMRLFGFEFSQSIFTQDGERFVFARRK